MSDTCSTPIEWLKSEARFASAEDRKSSLAAFEQARAIYEQRAHEAWQAAPK